MIGSCSSNKAWKAAGWTALAAGVGVRSGVLQADSIEIDSSMVIAS